MPTRPLGFRMGYRLPVGTVIEFRGEFRLVAGDGDRLRSHSLGRWTCRCGAEAATEHTRPRCDTHARGGDCGLDCTLSRVWCPSCGRSA